MKYARVPERLKSFHFFHTFRSMIAHHLRSGISSPEQLFSGYVIKPFGNLFDNPVLYVELSQIWGTYWNAGTHFASSSIQSIPCNSLIMQRAKLTILVWTHNETWMEDRLCSFNCNCGSSIANYFARLVEKFSPSYVFLLRMHIKALTRLRILETSCYNFSSNPPQHTITNPRWSWTHFPDEPSPRAL